MRVRANDARVHERRPLAGADVCRRVAQRAQARQKVGAVDRINVEAGERSHEPRDIAAGRLNLDRNRDGVTVIFDEEQDRQLLDARRAQRLPELAFARGAFAERHVGDLVGVVARVAIRNLRYATVDHGRFGRADRLQHLRARRARFRDDVEPFMAPVRRHLTAAGIRIVLGADGREQHLEGRHPELQAERSIAIVRIEPVVGRLQRQTGGDEHRFMACAADLEKDLALVLELNFLVVEFAREDHAAVDAQQRIFI